MAGGPPVTFLSPGHCCLSIMWQNATVENCEWEKNQTSRSVEQTEREGEKKKSFKSLVIKDFQELHDLIWDWLTLIWILRSKISIGTFPFDKSLLLPQCLFDWNLSQKKRIFAYQKSPKRSFNKYRFRLWSVLKQLQKGRDLIKTCILQLLCSSLTLLPAFLPSCCLKGQDTDRVPCWLRVSQICWGFCVSGVFVFLFSGSTKERHRKQCASKSPCPLWCS